MRRVGVTGMGIVSSIGNSAQEASRYSWHERCLVPEATPAG